MSSPVWLRDQYLPVSPKRAVIRYAARGATQPGGVTPPTVPADAVRGLEVVSWSTGGTDATAALCSRSYMTRACSTWPRTCASLRSSRRRSARAAAAAAVWSGSAAASSEVSGASAGPADVPRAGTEAAASGLTDVPTAAELYAASAGEGALTSRTSSAVSVRKRVTNANRQAPAERRAHHGRWSSPARCAGSLVGPSAKAGRTASAGPLATPARVMCPMHLRALLAARGQGAFPSSSRCFAVCTEHADWLRTPRRG